MTTTPAVLIVMSPQPPDQAAVHELSGINYSLMRCDDWQKPNTWRAVGPLWAIREVIWRNKTEDDAAPIWDAPYLPGDKMPLREEWSHVPIREDDGGQGNRMGVIYRADGEDAFDVIPDEWDFLSVWNSAESMPDWAVRHHGTVLSVEPVEQDGKWFWKIELSESTATK